MIEEFKNDILRTASKARVLHPNDSVDRWHYDNFNIHNR